MKKESGAPAKKSQKKISWLKKFLKNRRAVKRLIFLTVLLSVSLWLFWGIPLPTSLSSRQYPVSTKLFDRKGKLIYEIYSDKRRTPVKLEDLPEYVKSSTIAVEDKDFYKHQGFSITGIGRAAYNIVFKRKLWSTYFTTKIKGKFLLSSKKFYT